MLLFNSQVSGDCYKVRLLLTHLGMTYDRYEVDVIDRSNRAELLGALNPALAPDRALTHTRTWQAKADSTSLATPPSARGSSAWQGSRATFLFSPSSTGRRPTSSTRSSASSRREASSPWWSGWSRARPPDRARPPSRPGALPCAPRHAEVGALTRLTPPRPGPGPVAGEAELGAPARARQPCCEGELHPGRIHRNALERQLAESERLAVFDPLLDVGVGAMAAVELGEWCQRTPPSQ